MTNGRMVAGLGSRLLQRWGRDSGCGQGAGARKWGGSRNFWTFLSTFCSQVFILPTFSLFLHICQMGYLSLLTLAYSCPSIWTYTWFAYQQGLEKKRKKTQNAEWSISQEETLQRETKVCPLCAVWIIPTPFREWKKQKITLKFWTKSSLICFPLGQ